MDADFLVPLRASFDQQEAARAWARQQFPENAHLIDNARVEQVVLDVLGQTASDRAGDGAHVLVPAAEWAVGVGPTADVAAAVRAAAPRQSPCDYHGGDWAAPAALLPVVAPPHIVVLALCARCTAFLDNTYPSVRFIFLDATPDTPEGTTS